MLQWTFTFLILALVAGFFAFTSFGGTVALVAQYLFAAFLILLVVSGFSGVFLRRINGDR